MKGNGKKKLDRDAHTITIRTADEISPSGTIVEIDGMLMKGVTNIGFEHIVGRIPVVTLTLFATVEITGVAHLLEQRIKE